MSLNSLIQIYILVAILIGIIIITIRHFYPLRRARRTLYNGIQSENLIHKFNLKGMSLRAHLGAIYEYINDDKIDNTSKMYVLYNVLYNLNDNLSKYSYPFDLLELNGEFTSLKSILDVINEPQLDRDEKQTMAFSLIKVYLRELLDLTYIINSKRGAQELSLNTDKIQEIIDKYRVLNADLIPIRDFEGIDEDGIKNIINTL